MVFVMLEDGLLNAIMSLILEFVKVRQSQGSS